MKLRLTSDGNTREGKIEEEICYASPQRHNAKVISNATLEESVPEHISWYEEDNVVSMRPRHVGNASETALHYNIGGTMTRTSPRNTTPPPPSSPIGLHCALLVIDTISMNIDGSQALLPDTNYWRHRLTAVMRTSIRGGVTMSRVTLALFSLKEVISEVSNRAQQGCECRGRQITTSHNEQVA